MSLEKNENLVEKALLQMKSIEEAISENAKGILASTMKEEISELVKESLFGSKSKTSLHEQEEDDTDEIEGMDDETVDTDDSVEMGDVETEVEPDGDELDITAMMGTEVPTDNEDELPPLDMTGAKPDEVLKVFKAMGDEDGIIVVKDGNNIHLTDNNTDTEYFIDLGDDSDLSMEEPMENMDESVIYELVFEEKEDEANESEMYEEEDGEDGEDDDDDVNETIYELEVNETMKPVGTGFGKRKDGMSKSTVNNKGFEEDMADGKKSEKKGKGPKFSFGKIKHGVTESELDEDYMDEDYMDEGWMDEESIDTMKMEGDYMEGDDMYGGDEHDYKRRDGHKMGDVDGHYKDYEMEEGDYMEDDSFADELPGETTEASRTMTYMRRAQRDRVAAPSQLRKESVQKELGLLREKNEEYKKALDFFRNKLNEVAVFNSNLAYSTRLFTEHSTTKQEKINILRRFDNVETIKESKSLYKTIKSELEGGSKNDVVTESVQRELLKSPSNGSASNLIESKTYENPQFMRMRDLMAKIK